MPWWHGILVLRERAFDDIGKVARQTGRGLDALQRGLRLVAAALLQRAPAAERGGEPRRQLRIFRVEREHVVGGEKGAGAVGAVELGGVCLREGADQRAAAV